MPEPSLDRLKCIFHDNSSVIEISNRIQGNSLRNLGNFWSLILEWKREAQGILRRRDLLSTHLMPIFFVIFLWVVIYQVILIKQSRISRRRPFQLFKMVFILWRSTLEVLCIIKKLVEALMLETVTQLTWSWFGGNNMVFLSEAFGDRVYERSLF